MCNCRHNKTFGQDHMLSITLQLTSYYPILKILKFLTRQSLGEFLFLLFFFFFFFFLSAFCLLVLLTPFYLDQTFPKSFPNLTVWLSLAQLVLAWLSFALLCFCFTLFLSGILSPNLASFSPKPFGHVFIQILVLCCECEYPEVQFRIVQGFAVHTYFMHQIFS